MAALALNAPDASDEEVSRGLIAAGDVLRASGLPSEFVAAGRSTILAHREGRHAIEEGSWHWRASEVFELAQEAALVACYGTRTRADGSGLRIVRNEQRPG